MKGKLSLTRFFRETLGAPLTNSRTAWGSHDQAGGRVFLRVWEDQMEVRDGHRRVLVQHDGWTQTGHGAKQRGMHLQLIREGSVRAWAVICTAREPGSFSPREIGGYDDRVLFPVAGLVDEEEGRIFAQLGSAASVVEASAAGPAVRNLASDLAGLAAAPAGPTSVEALTQARVGQGAFRAALLHRWGGSCCVTGVSTGPALRASHIVPWSQSNDHERLDPHNGLLLVANLDALFDAGLIGFADYGGLLVSPRMSAAERQAFGLEGAQLRETPHGLMLPYLARHRDAMKR